MLSLLCCLSKSKTLEITKYGRYRVEMEAGSILHITSYDKGVVISFNSFNCGYFNVSGFDSISGELIYNKLEYVSSDFVGISMGKLLPNITIGFFMRGYIDFMAYVGFTEKYKTMYISTFDQCPFIFSQDNNDYNFKLVPNQQFILWYPNPNLKFVNISTYYGSSKGNMISNIDSTGRSTIYRIDGDYTFDSNNGMAGFQYQGISPISSKFFRFIPIASGYDHYFEYQQIIHYDDNPTNIYKYPLPTITPTPRKTEISLNTLIIIGIITLEAMIITTLSIKICLIKYDNTYKSLIGN